MSANSLPEAAPVWHSLAVEPAIELLNSNADSGLTSPEISQRLQKYGLNELKGNGGRSALEIFIDQFKNIMLLMLITVALISGVLDFISLQSGAKSNEVPFKDTIAILSIVILNGILGYVQESRAEQALAALKKLASPIVRVIRDGTLAEVPAQQLVPGDIILLEAGMHIAADGRLIEQSNLQVRESALTGEAEAVTKQVTIQLPENTDLAIAST